MKLTTTQWILPVLAALTLGGGCTTTQQGAGVGALLGAGIGQAVGRDTQSTVIGAVAGGMLGTVAGSLVESEQQEYALREAELNQQIATVESQIAQARNTNGRLRVRVAELKQEIGGMSASGARTAEETQRLRALIATASQQETIAQQQLAQVEVELRNARNMAARHSGNPRAQQLQQQITALEREHSQLKSTISQLASTTASVTL